MIHSDPPADVTDMLVGSFAACLSSVTEVPVSDLPDVRGASLRHALGAWKSWLAGRGAGLVPIDDPRTFQWAGWWIAVVGEGHGAHAALAFGTPPGVVLCPCDPSLIGRPTAELSISGAYVVASLDPTLAHPAADAPLRGVVEQLAVAPDAEAPMRLLSEVQALTGRGLEGDRYATGAGTFSPSSSRSPGYALTLIAAEVVEELTDRDATADFARTRRNVLTRGIDVNALVGRDFFIGTVRCRGQRLAEPCAHLERLHGPGLLRPLIHRGGLRVDILDGGQIRTGDVVTT